MLPTLSSLILIQNQIEPVANAAPFLGMRPAGVLGYARPVQPLMNEVLEALQFCNLISKRVIFFEQRLYRLRLPFKPSLKYHLRIFRNFRNFVSPTLSKGEMGTSLSLAYLEIKVLVSPSSHVLPDLKADVAPQHCRDQGVDLGALSATQSTHARNLAGTGFISGSACQGFQAM